MHLYSSLTCRSYSFPVILQSHKIQLGMRNIVNMNAARRLVVRNVPRLVLTIKT